MRRGSGVLARFKDQGKSVRIGYRLPILSRHWYPVLSLSMSSFVNSGEHAIIPSDSYSYGFTGARESDAILPHDFLTVTVVKMCVTFDRKN